jgi:hypothetical protein
MPEIFSRMDIQQIRAFLLYGEETCVNQNTTYSERLRDGEKPIQNRLKDLYHDEAEYEKAVSDLNEALIVYKEVHTEIGMKFAAKILFQ